MIDRLRFWFRHYFQARVVEQALDDELQACADIIANDARLNGASPADAARLGRMAIGPMGVTKERVRDVLPGTWWHAFRRDTAYAIRHLSRRPLFTLTSVVSLALGIGAATAVYSWGSHMFLRYPNGITRPNELLAVFIADEDPEAYTIISLPHFEEIRHAQTVFSDMAGSFRQTATLGMPDGAREVTIEFVTGSFFSTIGIPLLTGRGIEPNDDVPNGPTSVVLSGRMWRGRFGSAPDVVGRRIRLNGVPFTIVGVATPAFEGIEYHPYGTPEMWVAVHGYTPILRSDRVTRRAPLLTTYGRLKPFVTSALATSELNAMASRLSYLPKDTRHYTSVRTFAVNRMRMARRTEFHAFYPIAAIVAGLILAAGCFSIANFLISQGIARQAELGLRLSIGASRAQLFRQLLTECLVLGSGAGLLGVGTSYVAAALLERFPPVSMLGSPIKTPATIDGRALAFAIFVTIVATLACGMAPAALISSRSPLAGTVAGSRWFSPRRSVARQSILTLQVALSTLLTVIAALFASSLIRIDAQAYPYPADRIVLARVNPGAIGSDARRVFYRGFLEALRTRADVAAASLSGNPLLAIGGAQVSATMSRQGERSDFTTIGADYFKTLQVPLVAGREFTDEEQTMVTILNRTLAERLWPGQDAIGRTVYFPGLPPEAVPYTVVGVVDHPRCQDQTSGEWPCVYRPIHIDAATPLTLHVRTSRSAPGFFSDVHRLVARFSPDVVLDRASTLDEHLATVRAGPRVAATLTSGTALITSVLSAIGCAALLLSLFVESRREIAIRSAIGASPAHLKRIIMGQAVVPFSVGVGAGLIAAWGLATRISGQLFETPAHELSAFLGPALFLLAVGAAASYWPARMAGQSRAADLLR